MNTLGPFLVNPYEVTAISAGGIGAANLSIPVTIGQNGLIEIINYSTYYLSIQLNNGLVTQDRYSKVIYRSLQAQQGTQTIHILCTTQFQTQFTGLPNAAIQLQTPFGKDNSGGLIWLNIYQEGEIDWYPPLSIAPPRWGESNLAAATAPNGSGITLVVPTTSGVLGSATSISYVTGFDWTAATAAANTAITLTITNYNGPTMTYEIAANSGTVPFPLIVRFPDPIRNQPETANQITFTTTNVAAAQALNVYFFLT